MPPSRGVWVVGTPESNCAETMSPSRGSGSPTQQLKAWQTAWGNARKDRGQARWVRTVGRALKSLPQETRGKCHQPEAGEARAAF